MDYLKRDIAWCCMLTLFVSLTSAASRDRNVTIPGDFTIGAMFPITSAEKCGDEIIDQNGIQNLEALIFSLDKANKDILKEVGITLGTIAYDTCYSESKALERALDLVQGNAFEQNCKDKTRNSTPEKIIGVVGAATSAVSIQLASFLRLFKIPQISYSATSPELSDTNRYDYFRRTVSSDEYQAKAMMQVLKQLDITYVFGIYEDTSYGQEGILKIRNEAVNAGICIGESYRAKRFYTSVEEKDRELKSIVQQLIKTNSTTDDIVVILFASQEVVEGIFYEVTMLSRDQQARFRWVGSDAWTGREIDDKYLNVAASTIGLQPEIKIIPDFDKYFTSLDPLKHNTINPWFKMYWEQKFNCTLATFGTSSKISKVRVCKDSYRISTIDGTYIRNLNSYAVMDAVYAFAHALKNIHRDRCLVSGVCDAMKDLASQEVQHFLQNVSFIDIANREFRFYGNGGPARYSIMQNYNDSGTYIWQQLALYNDSKIIWNNTNNVPIPVFEPSQCSKPCGRGQEKSSRNQCCWSCKNCSFFEIVQDEICTPCREGELPDELQLTCIPITEMAMQYTNISAILLSILSCIGVIVTVAVAVIFHLNRRTPIIMASGKELSFVLLVGICLSYVSTFIFVAYPSPVQCGATRLMLGCCYTLGYAAILVKTNRIYRVFNIHIREPKKVKYIGAKSQLLITFAIVMVEVFALVIWIIVQPPEVTYIHPTRRDNIRVCTDSTEFAYLGSLAYAFLLMVLCVVYAVKTRKTPDGFNETRYITFGSYSFCIMWIAFISIYVSVKNNEVRIVSLCLAMTVNATVTLVTLFITKAYLVVLRPQKNTKENVMSRRRTRTYETIDLGNMSHLSRMASAVSTWHSTTNIADGGAGPFQMKKPVLPSTFGSNVSIAVLPDRQLHQSNGNIATQPTSLIRTVSVGHRNSDLLNVNQLERLSKSDNALNIESKDERDMIRNELVSKMLDIPNGLDPKLHSRRSLRSMRSRRRTRREKRPRSLELIQPPNIMVTPSSNENLNKTSTTTTFK